MRPFSWEDARGRLPGHERRLRKATCVGHLHPSKFGQCILQVVKGTRVVFEP